MGSVTRLEKDISCVCVCIYEGCSCLVLNYQLCVGCMKIEGKIGVILVFHVMRDNGSRVQELDKIVVRGGSTQFRG